MAGNFEDTGGQAGMDPSEKLESIRQEMNDALEARSQGNEGMARVCARRAVGWAIRLRFDETLAAANTKNAYVLLEWLSRQEAVAEPYRQAAERLSTRINEDHELPHDQDPLVDADFLIRGLLGIGETKEAEDT